MAGWMGDRLACWQAGRLSVSLPDGTSAFHVLSLLPLSFPVVLFTSVNLLSFSLISSCGLPKSTSGTGTVFLTACLCVHTSIRVRVLSECGVISPLCTDLNSKMRKKQGPTAASVFYASSFSRFYGVHSDGTSESPVIMPHFCFNCIS